MLIKSKIIINGEYISSELIVIFAGGPPEVLGKNYGLTYRGIASSLLTNYS
jgi:hypothetical protein